MKKLLSFLIVFSLCFNLCPLVGFASESGAYVSRAEKEEWNGKFATAPELTVDPKWPAVRVCNTEGEEILVNLHTYISVGMSTLTRTGDSGLWDYNGTKKANSDRLYEAATNVFGYKGSENGMYFYKIIPWRDRESNQGWNEANSASGGKNINSDNSLFMLNAYNAEGYHAFMYTGKDYTWSSGVEGSINQTIDNSEKYVKEPITLTSYKDLKGNPYSLLSESGGIPNIAKYVTSRGITYAYNYVFKEPSSDLYKSQTEGAYLGHADAFLSNIDKMLSGDGKAGKKACSILSGLNPNDETTKSTFEKLYKRLTGGTNGSKQFNIIYDAFVKRFYKAGKWDFTTKPNQTVVYTRFAPFIIQYIDAADVGPDPNDPKHRTPWEKIKDNGYKWDPEKGEWVKEKNLSLTITSVTPDVSTIDDGPSKENYTVNYEVYYEALEETNPLSTDLSVLAGGDGKVVTGKDYVTPVTLNPGKNTLTENITDVSLLGEEGKLNITLEVNPKKDKPNNESTYEDNKDSTAIDVSKGELSNGDVNLKLDIDSITPNPTVVYGNQTTKSYTIEYHVDANIDDCITTNLSASLSGGVVSNISKSTTVNLAPGKNYLTYTFSNVNISGKNGNFTVKLEVNPNKNNPDNEVTYDDNKDTIIESVSVGVIDNPNAKNPCEAFKVANTDSWIKPYTVTTHHAHMGTCPSSWTDAEGNSHPTSVPCCKNDGDSSESRSSKVTETLNITKIGFKSKDTPNEVNMITNSAKAIVKAGYGFDFNITATHKVTESDKPSNHTAAGGTCGNGRKTVSPGDTYLAESLNQVYVVDSTGQVLTNKNTNANYKQLLTCTHTKKSSTEETLYCSVVSRNVNGIKNTNKLYVSDKQKDGKYNLTVCTMGIKSTDNNTLFDRKNVYYVVKGANADDVDISIIQ